MSIFLELSIIVVLAALLSGLMRLFKQPLVIGYVLAGLLLGPTFLNLIKSTEAVSVLSEMGIAILLFIVGLNLSPKEIKHFGKTSFLIGFFQIAFSMLFGVVSSLYLGFSIVEGLYIGIGLAFSSTIIVLKFLSDKKDIEKLYGRVSIGILLFQDIVAAITLIIASTFSGGTGDFATILLLVIKIISLTLGVSLVSFYVLPKFGDFFAKSQEYLFIFSLAWGFGLASLFGYLGFSIEIGALIAGVSLSISPYSPEISSKLKPLRDFFVVIFFVLLGTKIQFANFSSLVWPISIFLIFILLIKPLIIAILAELFGYNRKVSFLTGFNLSQISEFSMIVGMLGVRVGHISENVLSLITMLGFLSIALSSYIIKYDEKLFPLFSSFLKIFEKKKLYKETFGSHSYDIVLFGCNRVGYDFVKLFSEMGTSFLAVDFDPEVIKNLNKQGVNCVYGDAEDSDFLDDINIGKAKIIVSTIPNHEANVFLVSKVRKASSDALVLVISYDIDEALQLYEHGASYVILPHFIGGEFAARLTVDVDFDNSKLHGKREKHIEYLKERKSLGHTHPISIIH